MKTCHICKLEKPLIDFHKMSKSKDGHQGRCKPCAIATARRSQEKNPERHLENARRYAAKNPAKRRDTLLRNQYGISLAQYLSMHEAQGGLCAICSRPERARGSGKDRSKARSLAVDHCHTTGRVRDLLCHDCNTAIGKFQDSPQLLQKAIEYLDKHAKSGIIEESTGPLTSLSSL